MAAPAHATPHFTVGQGQNPGVAIDAAGTAYIGWQVNTHAGTGDSVQLCVLPAGARACASLAAVPFPGGLFAARRHDRLAATRVSRLPITALPTAHETVVVLIEPARTSVPATVTVTVPAHRFDTGTPRAWTALVDAGAQSATAHASASSRGRVGPHSPAP